jgi:hypothetical protein
MSLAERTASAGSLKPYKEHHDQRHGLFIDNFVAPRRMTVRRPERLQP